MEAAAHGRPCLVVGYDGSDSARAAVTYAAERLGPHGRLCIVHAVGSPLDSARDRGRAILDELSLDSGNVLLDSDFEVELVPGGAADAVVEAAKECDADEIVLGSRGQGRIGSLLGSVSEEVLRSADRPVVVIPYNAVRRRSGAQS